MNRPTPTLWLPKYAAAQHFLRIMDGSSYSKFGSMLNDITSKAGSRGSTVSWTEPDSWIPDRLKLFNDSRRLAMRIWQESEHVINPRWTYEIWRFIAVTELAAIRNDAFFLLPNGERFIESEATIIKEIDENEGVLYLLSEIADRGPGTRKDFIRNFISYFRHVTTWSDSSIASSYSARLNNLLDRNLIIKAGSTYRISDAGLAYLQRVSASDDGFAVNAELVVNQKNAHARAKLATYLEAMDPIMFEHLVKLLLEEMGYQDVEVTSPTNDKGVDVIANIQLGISSVREVIQVKRYRGSIGRPILDQLRGSLFYFQAVRGSIITTGHFAKSARAVAFVPNAPPITLIDRERLLDLLIENNIGIRRREIRMLEFDKESLSEFESDVSDAIASNG